MEMTMIVVRVMRTKGGVEGGLGWKDNEEMGTREIKMFTGLRITK
jgi:hypothetical protein